MKTRIIFRVDSDQSIGLGHLIRSYSLAMMIAEDFRIEFSCRSIPGNWAEKIKTAGWKLHSLQDQDDFFGILQPRNIVVLDGYSFDRADQLKLKKNGCKTVCIDDMQQIDFLADLIVNHTPGLHPFQYRSKAYTQFALGLDYALLRPAFLSQSTSDNTADPSTVFICFGGADPKNLTTKVTKSALEFNWIKSIHIVTGQLFSHDASLKPLVKSDDRIQHFHAIEEQQMRSIMTQSGLAIIPSSSILLEVLASGCKAISGYYVNNQVQLYENGKQLKLFTDAGDFSDLQLKKAIISAQTNPLPNSKVIDGRSGERLKVLFQRLEQEFEVRFEKANTKHRSIAFKWATDPDIRKYSFSKHSITWEEHTKWYDVRINDDNCYYYIAYLNNKKPFGSIRFDISNTTAKISFLIDRSYFGKGFGQILLKTGIETFLTDQEHTQKVVNKLMGEVDPSNKPSIKTFQRLGFHEDREASRIIYSRSIA